MAAEAVWDIATRSCLRSHTRAHNDVYNLYYIDCVDNRQFG